MYYHNDSQLQAFAGTELYADVATYYALARENHEIDYFEVDIANDRTRIDRCPTTASLGSGGKRGSSSSS